MDDDQIPQHFVTSSSQKVSFFKRGFKSVFGVSIRQLLSSGKLELEEINKLLHGSKSFDLSVFENIFQTKHANGSDPFISPLRKVRRDKWKKGAVLGQGSFGLVRIGLANDGSFFAAKEIQLYDENLEKLEMKEKVIMREVILSCQLDHPNTVKYLGDSGIHRSKLDSGIHVSKLDIFMEVVTGPDTLQNVYETFEGGLEHSQVSFYTRQILEGLKYLHERNVVHRDIKCANILVKEDGCIKIIDFGLAKVTNTSILQSNTGTKYWKAPEVHINVKYGTEADVWSLGCTMLEMFTGKHPFYENPEVYEHQIKKGLLGLPSLPDYLSREASHFILECLEFEQGKRPTAAKLLKHKFVKSSCPASGSNSDQP